MSDLKMQGEVSLDSTDAEQALGRVEQRAGKMAQTVKQSGQDAGQGVAAIGNGADGAAQKVDAATKSLIGSIQRTTAATEAGGRATAKYYEVLAQQRGISPDVLKPYIDALKQSEASQKSGSASLGELGNSANLTSQQMQGLTHSARGVFDMIASGASPMRALAIEGGRLTGTFGGVGAAVSGVANAAAGLLNPVALLGVAVVGLAAGAIAGAREFHEFETALTLSGNAVGLTLSQYTGLRQELGTIAGQGKAADALLAIAKNGQIASVNVRTVGEAAIRMSEATGESVDKVVEQFASLVASPAAAAIKLNDSYNFLTASTYRQIKALEDQGRTVDAARIATDAFAQAVGQRAGEVEANVGIMSRAWKGLVDIIKSGVDAAKNVGAPLSTAQQLALVQGKIRDAQGLNPNRPGGALPFETPVSELQEQERYLTRKLFLEGEIASQQASQADGTRAETEWQKIVDANLNKQQQLQLEIKRIRNAGVADGKSEADIQEQINRAKQRYNDIAGASDVAARRADKLIAQEELNRLNKAIANLDFSTPTKLTDGEKKVILIQQQLQEGLMGVARANKERELSAAQASVQDEKDRAAAEKRYDLVKKTTEVLNQQATAVSDQGIAIRQQADEQDAANSVFGKGKVAMEELRAAQMRATLAELQEMDTANPKYIAGLQFKIEQQERYVASLQRAADKQLAFNGIQLADTNARETALLGYELSVIGQVADVRSLLIERRRIELDYAQKIADVDRSEGTEAGKADARRVLDQQKQVALSNATTKAVVDQWQKASDEISSALTDAFVQAFENGGNLGKNLVQALKTEFANLVLKPTIQAAINATGIPQALGQVTSANNLLGLSKAPSLFSPGGIGDSVLGVFGGGSGIAGTAASGAEIAGTVSSTSEALASLGAGAGEAATAASALGESMAAVGSAGSLTAAMAAIPGWGWAALAAAAVISFIGKGGGPKDNSSYNYFQNTGDPTGAKAIANAINAGFLQLTGQLHVTAPTLNAGVAYAKDPQGKALTQLDITSAAVDYSRGGLYGTTENVGRSDAEFTAAIAQGTEQAMISGLEHSDLDQKFKDYLSGIDLKSSADELSARIADVVNVKSVADSFKVLGPAFDTLRNQAIEATKSFITAAGGFDSLSANLTDYYSNFYSDDEKRVNTLASISAKLAAVGLSLDGIDTTAGDAREKFRAMVEAAAKDTSDAGQAQLTALLSVENAFASVTTAATSTAAAVNAIAAPVYGAASGVESLAQAIARLSAPVARTTEDIAKSIIALQGQAANLNIELLRALGNNPLADSEQRKSDTAGFTDAEVAQYDYNAALRKTIDAVNAAAQVEQQRNSLESQYAQVTGDVAQSRQMELDAMDASLRPLQERIYAFQDEQAATQSYLALAGQRQSLEQQILQLQGNTAALRAAEVNAMDASLQPFQLRIYALQDEAAAAAKAATAAQAQAASMQAIASKQDGLMQQIWQLTGDTASARQAELAALDPSLRALQQYVYSLQDQQAASQAASTNLDAVTTASQDAANAADQLAQAWKGATDSVISEVQRIRQQVQAADAEGGLAAAASSFAIAKAKASAGDLTAYQSLPALSQQYLSLVEQNATSSLDLRRIQSSTATGLENLATYLSGGSAAPATVYAPPAGLAALTSSSPASPVAGASSDTIVSLLTQIKKNTDQLPDWNLEGIPQTRTETAS